MAEKSFEKFNFSSVEKVFINASGNEKITTQIPYVIVPNFPNLGLLTALRFIEWVHENPQGIISLPTGKTPEFFIKWVQFILNNWESNETRKILETYQLNYFSKPSLKHLHFVQLDEFYPISSSQHNSFHNYVEKFYIKGFGLDPEKALLINSDEIILPNNQHFSTVFPDSKVDLTLRYRECKNKKEDVQQKAIFCIDEWCSQYENKIRNKGGIGFFLGGIGPDGHIAFNTRGTDFNSTTRLTETNFETQAVAATDLGGIEVSSNRLVITIGLETITYNPNATAIIIAAGEAKAPVIQKTLENNPSNLYPASVLSRLRNARFYLTEGAATKLSDRMESNFKKGEWTDQKTEKAIIGLSRKINKFGSRLSTLDFQNDRFTSFIPESNEKALSKVTESIKEKIQKGLQPEKNQIFLHTGPHHDDIMLGLLPHISKHLQEPSNQFFFSILTSGFTAVTNKFVIEILQQTNEFISQNRIEMIHFPDFFESGYQFKWDKDIYHYLTNVAAEDEEEKRRGVCHRIIRAIVAIYKIGNQSTLIEKNLEIIEILKQSYDGEKNDPAIQKLKGMIREFEEELVWAHYGIPVKNIIHNRLGFYKGDVFTEQPDKMRDVLPVAQMIKDINPTVLSITFDPEGSGPDTHYKVLQTIADALRHLQKERDLSDLRIWGYRNVWFKFSPSDVNRIVPVSLNAMASMDALFTNCYLSQVEASFPSYELNGKFSKVAQKIWVDQLKSIQYLLGKDYFYQNEDPRIRASHGLIFYKEMTVTEFLIQARELQDSIEGGSF